MNIYELDYIETPRLRIRPIKIGDEFELNKLINNSLTLLQKWQPWANDPSLETTTKFVEKGAKNWQNKQGHNLPMVISLNSKIIGGTGFNDRSDFQKGIYEIGYWLDINYQGNGYVTETVNSLSKFAFENLNAKKIILRMEINNDKSKSIADKLNFDLKEVTQSLTNTKSKDFVYELSDRIKLPKLEFINQCKKK